MKRKYYSHVRDFDFRIPETIFDKDVVSLVFLIINLFDFCLFYMLREIRSDSVSLMLFVWFPLQILITFDAINFTIRCSSYHIRYMTWYYVMWMVSRISAVISVIVVLVFLKANLGQVYYYHMGSFSIYRGLLPSLGPVFRMKKSHTRWIKEYYIPDFFKSIARITYSVVAFIFCYAGLFQIFNTSIGSPSISTIDAVYYTMVSIASIGYGDIYPTNNLSKVVLCFYIIAFLGNLPIFVRNSTEELHVTMLLHKLRSACKNGVTVISDQSISFVYLLRLILPANVRVGFIDLTDDENPHLKNTCYSFNNMGYINLNTCGAQAKRRALDYEFLVNSLVGKSRKIVLLSPVSLLANTDSNCLAMALNCSRVAKEETQLIIMTREGARSQTLQSHIGAYHENCYIIDITDFSAKLLVLAILFPGFATFFFNIMLPSHVSLHKLENRTADFYNERIRTMRIRTGLLLANARAKGLKMKLRKRGGKLHRMPTEDYLSDSMINVDPFAPSRVTQQILDTAQQIYSPHVRFKDLQSRHVSVSLDVSPLGYYQSEDSVEYGKGIGYNVSRFNSVAKLPRPTRHLSMSTIKSDSSELMPSASLPEIPFTNPAISLAVASQHTGSSFPVPLTLENLQSACVSLFSKESSQQASCSITQSTISAMDKNNNADASSRARLMYSSRSKDMQLTFNEAITQFVERITKFPTIQFLHAMIETPVFDLHPGLIHDNKWRAWASFEQNKRVHLFLPAMIATSEAPNPEHAKLVNADSAQQLPKPQYLRKSSIDPQSMARYYNVNNTLDRFKPLAVLTNRRMLQRKEDDCLNYKDIFVEKWLFTTKLFTFDICCNLREKLSLDKPNLANIAKRFPIYEMKSSKPNSPMLKSQCVHRPKKTNRTFPSKPRDCTSSVPAGFSLNGNATIPYSILQSCTTPLVTPALLNDKLHVWPKLSISNATLPGVVHPPSEPEQAIRFFPPEHSSISTEDTMYSEDSDESQPTALREEYVGILNPQFNDFAISSTIMNHTLSLGAIEKIKLSAKGVNSLGLIILDDLEPKLFYAMMFMLMELRKIYTIVLIFDSVSGGMVARYRSILYKLASTIVDQTRRAVPENQNLCHGPTLERICTFSCMSSSYQQRPNGSTDHFFNRKRGVLSPESLRLDIYPDDGIHKESERLTSNEVEDVDQSWQVPQELYVTSQEDIILTYTLPSIDEDPKSSKSTSQLYSIKLFNMDSTIPEDLLEIRLTSLDRTMIINPTDSSVTTEGHLLLTKSACELIGYGDVIVYSMDVYNTLMLHDLGFGDNYRSGSFIPSVEAILTGTFIQHSENALTALILMNKIYAHKESIATYHIIFDERTNAPTIFANLCNTRSSKKLHGKRFSQRVLTVEALQSFLGCCGLEVLYYSICGCILIAPDPSLFVEHEDFVVVYSSSLF